MNRAGADDEHEMFEDVDAEGIGKVGAARDRAASRTWTKRSVVGSAIVGWSLLRRMFETRTMIRCVGVLQVMLDLLV
jgi:hypothetical protein